MPIHMDIVPIHRLVVIVARGHLTADDISANATELRAANVPTYAKILDFSSAKSELTREQIDDIAATVRGDAADGTRGPVAFVVNPDQPGFAEAFTDATQGERPIKTFRSLHEARRWLDASRLISFRSVA
jgi:hypothetical protein